MPSENTPAYHPILVSCCIIEKAKILNRSITDLNIFAHSLINPFLGFLWVDINLYKTQLASTLYKLIWLYNKFLKNENTNKYIKYILWHIFSVYQKLSSQITINWTSCKQTPLISCHISKVTTFRDACLQF